jgi:hypothetical protein
MAITITWNDGVNPATGFTITDDMALSLEKFRQTLMTIQSGAMVPVYASVQEMFVGVYMLYMVSPALNLFPTASVLSAQQAVATAQANLAVAQASAIPDFATIT